MAVVLCDELVESRRDDLIELASSLIPQQIATGYLVAGDESDKTVKMVGAVAPIHRRAAEDVLQHGGVSGLLIVGHG